MYTLGKFIGRGGSAYFFGIQGHKRLGAKVKIDNNKLALEEEFAKAQILRKVGAPVPRYVGVVPIAIPNDFKSMLQRQVELGEVTGFTKGGLERFPDTVTKIFGGKVLWGLVIEIIDAVIVDRDKVALHYQRERNKLEKLGIKIKDSTLVRNHNVLWSKKKNKLFFIDFERWEVPSYVLKVHGVRSFLSKIFKRAS